MSVTALSATTLVSRISTMRQQMEALQIQLTTEKKSTSYAGLGSGRMQSVTFRQQIANLDAYSSTIDLVSTRIKLMDTALTRIGEIPSDVKSAIDPNAFVVLSDGKTAAQKTAQVALQETIGLLNSDAAGRHLFAGDETDAAPVVDYDTMMNGDGTRAGFLQYTEERRMADLGADGLGRLATARTGSTVTLRKDTPVTTTFGFDITGVSTTMTGVTASVSGSPAQLSVNFTGQPVSGQTIAIELTNPDGTTSTVELQATTGPEVEDGQFLIGTTLNATAQNFRVAMSAGVAAAAETDLAAASAMAAADDFFDTAGGALPQRVDTSGGSAYEAVGLVDADPASSVIWYTGQNDASPARSGASAKVDSNITVDYGARANEESLVNVVKNLAAMAAASFDESVATDEARYAALAERVDTALDFPDGAPNPQDLHAEIAVAAATIEAADDRHVTSKAAMQDLVSDVEGIDKFEVSAQLLQLQTQLEASYQTTSMLYQLSLVNYL
ncbi:flagellin [Methylobrevis pamukkalensis]|uniref:Flagellar hook-associated protein FlgL n=1 Tax=Methylobrevis pamukkalensis TaxID=1439726 RepID=A0A1E3H366_9HYPH|nr:hypothetical protein [Methylobrevis pamukkalensis]ODN70769.1 flagellar hook-associated protein FlgL [Methylobrevis pamukkalensis]